MSMLSYAGLRYSFLVVVLAFALAGCSMKYSFPLPSDQPLTEAVAVEMSRNALKEAGVEVSKYQAVPFASEGSPAGEQLFARNSNERDRGYVLWRESGTALEWSYQVYVSRKGDKVVCEVLKAK
jgi:hypothetical protein